MPAEAHQSAAVRVMPSMVKGRYIQNTNSLHSRYEEFIRRFRGPASKYLPLYLAWFLYAQRGTQPRTAFAEIIRA